MNQSFTLRFRAPDYFDLSPDVLDQIEKILSLIGSVINADYTDISRPPQISDSIFAGFIFDEYEVNFQLISRQLTIESDNPSMAMQVYQLFTGNSCSVPQNMIDQIHGGA